MRFLRDLKRGASFLLEKYDAMRLLKTMAEHVGDIVRLSHCFFEGRPFKMNIVEHEEDLHAAGGGAPGR